MTDLDQLYQELLDSGIFSKLEEAGFEDGPAIAAAPDEDILSVKGIGAKTLEKLRELYPSAVTASDAPEPPPEAPQAQETPKAGGTTPKASKAPVEAPAFDLEATATEEDAIFPPEGFEYAHGEGTSDLEPTEAMTLIEERIGTV